jgi:hypothetical protein
VKRKVVEAWKRGIFIEQSTQGITVRTKLRKWSVRKPPSPERQHKQRQISGIVFEDEEAGA